MRNSLDFNFGKLTLSPTTFDQETCSVRIIPENEVEDFSLELKLWSSGGKILRDPLTREQQLLIKKFVDKYILNSQFKEEHKYSKDKSNFEILKKFDGTVKSLNGQEKTIIKTIFDGNDKAFTIFSNTILYPETKAKEFGIDPKKSESTRYAVNLFIRSLLKTDPNSYTFCDAYQIYRKKISTEKWNREFFRVSKKNALLMMNDPVQKLQHDNHILANTHFETPEGLERETAREMITEAFKSLLESNDTKYLIDAINKILKEHKGHFFISGTSDVDHFKTRFKSKNPTLTHLGYFNGHSSIFCESLLRKNTSNDSWEINPRALGTLVHELLHYTLEKLSKINQITIFNNPDYKQAILDDLIHRNSLDTTALSYEELYALTSTLSLIAEMEDTFNTKFDPFDPLQMSYLLNEAIVLPLDLLTEKIPLKAIENIMPNITKIFFRDVQNSLKEYVIDIKSPKKCVIN